MNHGLTLSTFASLVLQNIKLASEGGEKKPIYELTRIVVLAFVVVVGKRLYAAKTQRPVKTKTKVPPELYNFQSCGTEFAEFSLNTYAT